MPPSRILDGSSVFTPSGSIESFTSHEPQEIPSPLISGTSHFLNRFDLTSFSFRWDSGLDCEDEDGSISDYGTVLHTGETNLSAPLTTTTGLSAVEEITESGLTDSGTPSTMNQLSLAIPPGDNELGLLPSHGRGGSEVKKGSKSILGRLRSASNRIGPRLSIPWIVFTPTVPVVKVHANAPEKPSAVPHSRPKNKLRKKTRPSIAIALAVEPLSSFSLAQPLTQPLGVLQAGTSSVSVSPVAGFPSARSFFSFELPPVFSKARSKALRKSNYRPPEKVDVIKKTSTLGLPDVGPSGPPVREFGGRISVDNHSGKDNERTMLADNGVGGFPAPLRPASDYGQRDSEEETPAHRRSRLTSPWELGLEFGQDLGLRVRSLLRARGG